MLLPLSVRSRLLRLLSALLPGELDSAEYAALLAPWQHDPLLASRRVALVVDRVRLFAFVFAVLTPLWSVIDYLFFPWPLWMSLAAMRLLASLAFGFIVAVCRAGQKIESGWLALAFLFLVPTLFFLGSQAILASHKLEGLASAVSAGYAFLPFVLIAGLSIFPLTLIENAVLVTPILASQIYFSFIAEIAPDLYLAGGVLWLLLLLAAILAIAGASQLAGLIMLLRQTVRDPLTGAFSRLAARELLSFTFEQAVRGEGRLAIAFIDIDHFKRLNDAHGHAAGDAALAAAAHNLAARMRSADFLARWGGEEFLLVMPDTDPVKAQSALLRLCDGGLGRRPDRSPLTASIGLAERIADGANDWHTLVAIADERMYAAKQAGRNRIVGLGGAIVELALPAGIDRLSMPSSCRS